MQRYRLPHPEFNILIEVKLVKGLRMRVRDEIVFISAPPGITREMIEKFVAENIDWIRGCFQRKKQPKLTPEIANEFMKAFPERFESWLMKMNETFTHVTFRNMTSRWGSCNPASRRFTFNLRLALVDEECLDYVIVHEIAHLQHPDHSPAFWAHVEKFMPNYREVRARLKNS